jgi:hypothetical protein
MPTCHSCPSRLTDRHSKREFGKSCPLQFRQQDHLHPIGSELKLYRSTKDTRWFAFDAEIGWVTFPAEVGGWQKRKPYIRTDTIDLRETSLSRGFNTGIPGAPVSAAGAWDLPFQVSRIGPDKLNRRIKAMDCLPLSKSAA